MKLKVYRENGDCTAAHPMRCSEGLSPFSSAHHDTFELAVTPGATVLSLLFEARDRYDDSLAFRYSCRGAVCGSCAMLINKVPRLACRTQVEALLGKGPGGQGFQGSGRLALSDRGRSGQPSNPRTPEPDEVLVEPLPHLPVLKDLVVDMTRFYELLRAVQPVLQTAASAPDREYRMEPSAVRELEQYTNCILCGACYGACPVCGENAKYLGPAALAQLYRFHIDPREARDGSRLTLADKPDGWWACRFYANCRTVCPKAVPPNLAIGRARQELKPRNPHPSPLPEGEGRDQRGRTVDPIHPDSEMDGHEDTKTE